MISVVLRCILDSQVNHTSDVVPSLPTHLGDGEGAERVHEV